MNLKILSEWLLNLSLKQRTQKLNRISHDLTICAREFQLPPLSEDKPRAVTRLIGFSELQHKLSAQIGHYCSEDTASAYPVEVLSSILFEIANQYGITPFFKKAVHHSMTGSWRIEEPATDEPTSHDRNT